MSLVFGVVDYDVNIVYLHIFFLRTWIFSELTLMRVPKKRGIMGNTVRTLIWLKAWEGEEGEEPTAGTTKGPHAGTKQRKRLSSAVPVAK